jgi:pyruvate ferredoxin oxidoreductase alpha subunit
MGEKKALTGNEAVALAMKQVEPDVVAAYPITPQTDIVQYFSSFVADGKVKTEFVTVESEHSAMSATVGAAAAGARAMTATSSQGLALMWEVVYIAASTRLPIVMPVVNRALSAPINIHCDHSDTMGARDSGWIQLYSESVQEAYDNLIQAVRIAEHPDVQLPVMVCLDGFITSHGLENVEILDDATVKGFVGEYKPRVTLLDPAKPITFGALDLQDYYFEHKRSQAEAMYGSGKVVLEVGEEFGRLTGRRYGYFDAYRLDDADVAVVVMNSTAGTAKVVVDELRQAGSRVGLLKLRVFRPFPHKEIADALKRVKVVAVMDRADSFNAFGGPVFNEVRSAMYECPGPKILSYVYGLGGRDVGPADVVRVYDDLLAVNKTGRCDRIFNYLGVRE